MEATALAALSGQQLLHVSQVFRDLSKHDSASPLPLMAGAEDPHANSMAGSLFELTRSVGGIFGKLGITPGSIEKYLPQAFSIIKSSIGPDGKVNVLSMVRGVLGLADTILENQQKPEQAVEQKPEEKAEPGNASE